MITGNLVFQHGANWAVPSRPIPTHVSCCRPDKDCRRDFTLLSIPEDHHLCSHLPPFF